MSDTELVVAVKDKSNARSVINMLPSSVAKAIEVIPDDTFALGEADLKARANPSEVEERLRISFWREYDMAQYSHRKMNLTNVTAGVCSMQYLHKHVTTNATLLAYVLTPPPDYEVAMLDLLNLGLQQMREIMLLPNITEEGEVDSKLAGVKQKIVEQVILRVKGAVPYKIQSENLNVNVSSQPRQVEQGIDMDDINKQLAELADLELGNANAREVKALEAGNNRPSGDASESGSGTEITVGDE